MEETLHQTMDELFLPMLFTSLTTVVGFASLVMTPIPPVQVFGAFVAFGVFVAWLLSLLFIPAYAMLMPPSALDNFGQAHEGDGRSREPSPQDLRDFSMRCRVPVLVGLVVVMIVAGYGVIAMIVVNDNPVNWFKTGHPLRVADQVMNEHLPAPTSPTSSWPGEERRPSWSRRG